MVNMSPAFLTGTFNLKRQGLWDEAEDQIKGEPTCVNLSSQLKVRGTFAHGEVTLTLPAASGNLRQLPTSHRPGVTGRETFRSLRLEGKSAEIGRWEDGRRGNSHIASAQTGGFGRRCCCGRYQVPGDRPCSVRGRTTRAWGEPALG